MTKCDKIIDTIVRLCIPRTEVDCCETCLQNDEGAQKQTHPSPPFSSPYSQFWLGPLNILLLKDQTYFCFEVCLALNKHRCVWGMQNVKNTLKNGGKFKCHILLTDNCNPLHPPTHRSLLHASQTSKHK